MTPLRALRKAVEEFERQSCRYCLIGGHAASLYRSRERLTRDVDFAVVGIPPETSRKVAEAVIEGLGMESVLGFIPGGPAPGKRGAVCMITSRPARGELSGMIDILLPKLPWIEDAVARAQLNRIDLGFAPVPVITPEDLVVAKCCALSGAPDRFQDLDDLKEIFTGPVPLDLDYLKLTLEKHALKIPKPLRSSAPPVLRRLCL